MNIVFSTNTPDIQSTCDPRFGRAACFVVIDPESQQWQAYPNPGQQASGGAGIKAAQFIASLENVQAIVSGDFGPNAFEALEAAQIGMFLYDDCQTVAEALARFQAGALQAVTVPTQKGHHGQPS